MNLKTIMYKVRNMLKTASTVMPKDGSFVYSVMAKLRLLARAVVAEGKLIVVIVEAQEKETAGLVAVQDIRVGKCNVPDKFGCRGRAIRHPADIIKLNITAKRIRDSCSNCGGTGKRPCSTCNGSGKVTCRNCSGNGYVTCPRCGGSGRNTCQSARGNPTDALSICATRSEYNGQTKLYYSFRSV